jgi:hypothetical protein
MNNIFKHYLYWGISFLKEDTEMRLCHGGGTMSLSKANCEVQ